MARGRSSGRIKTGNIFLLLLIGLGIYYMFNKSMVDQKLKELGFLEPESKVEQVIETNEDSTTDIAEETEAEINNTDVTTTTTTNAEEVPAAAPAWSILTEGVDEFYVDEINKFTVRADGDLVPVVMGKGVSVKTVDKAKGLYELMSKKTGTIEINLFGDVNGKRGIVGAKSFEIVKRVGQKNSEYLWDINSNPKDTLFVGKDNKVTALIAEVASKDLILEVEKGRASLANAKTGLFILNVEAGKTAKVKLFLNKGGGKTLVGEKEFVLVDTRTENKADVEIPSSPKTTDVVDKKTNNNTRTNANETETTGSACGIKILNQFLFMGINNPVQIEVGDVPKEELLVEFDKEVVQADAKGVYRVKPSKIGQKKLEVYQNKDGVPKLLTTTIFQVKAAPHPIPYVEGKSGGGISTAKLQKAKKINAKLHLLDFDTNFEVTSFKLGHYSSGGTNNRGVVENKGALFNSSVRKLLSKAKKGDVYVFTDIRVAEKDSFGLSRTLSSIAFTVE